MKIARIKFRARTVKYIEIWKNQITRVVFPNWRFKIWWKRFAPFWEEPKLNWCPWFTLAFSKEPRVHRVSSISAIISKVSFNSDSYLYTPVSSLHLDWTSSILDESFSSLFLNWRRGVDTFRIDNLGKDRSCRTGSDKIRPPKSLDW